MYSTARLIFAFLTSGFLSGCLHFRGDAGLRSGNFPDQDEKSQSLASQPTRIGGYLQTLWPIQFAGGILMESDFADKTTDLGYDKVTSSVLANDYLLGLRWARSDFAKMDYNYMRLTHYRPNSAVEDNSYTTAPTVPDGVDTATREPKHYQLRKGWRFGVGYDRSAFGAYSEKNQSVFMGSYFGEVAVGYQRLRLAGQAEGDDELSDFRRKYVEVSIGVSFSVMSWEILKAILDAARGKNKS